MRKHQRPGTKPASPAKPETGGGLWLYGIHPVAAALQNPKREVLQILATSAAAAKLEKLRGPKHPAIELAEAEALNKRLPPGAVHQGAGIRVKPLDWPPLETLLESGGPVVLLDQVTDPHNVGAILRSAAAFGAAAVVVTQHHAPQETGVLAKSASGALDIVPLVTVTNLAQTMESLKKLGYWCAGLDGSASQSIAQAKLTRKTALILGAEGEGMRRLTQERCDFVVKLPISARMESLNVSNAAAIALYELSRNG